MHVMEFIKVNRYCLCNSTALWKIRLEKPTGTQMTEGPGCCAKQLKFRLAVESRGSLAAGSI